jgi:hypothetical protein
MHPELPKQLTPEQAENGRSAFLDDKVIPLVQAAFERIPALHSAMFSVAQFWDDEADDAVHTDLMFSERSTPYLETWDEGDEDSINLPTCATLLRTFVDQHRGLLDEGENDANIPLFAAFTQEGVNRDEEKALVFSPYAVLRRTSASIDVQLVGTMHRPWLDGVQPIGEGGVHEQEYEAAYPDTLSTSIIRAKIPPASPTTQIPKRFTSEQAATERNNLVNGPIADLVRHRFMQHPALQSATFAVAQFFNDEAADAVHYEFVFSELATPDLAAAWKDVFNDEDPETDRINFPTIPDESIAGMNSTWEITSDWEDSNDINIPLFAAFCLETSQEDEYLDAYSPYAIFRRNGSEIEINTVGTMLRPWLDGVMPLVELDEQGAEPGEAYNFIYGDATPAEHVFGARSDTAPITPPPERPPLVISPNPQPKSGWFKRLFGR